MRCGYVDGKTDLLLDLPGQFCRAFSFYVHQYRHSRHGRSIRRRAGPHELGRDDFLDDDGCFSPALGKGLRCPWTAADLFPVAHRLCHGDSGGGLCPDPDDAHHFAGHPGHRPIRRLCVLYAPAPGDDGWAVALTYLGLSLGPVIGGALTQFVGWRCIFLLSALAIVISYAFIRPIKEEWYANGAPFVNLVSSGLSIAGILCALYGLSSFEDYSASFWIGLVLLVVFVIHEGKSFHPLLPLYLFRNLTFSMSNLAALIQYSATYAVSFLLSLYFQVILGLPPAVSGAILLVQPIIMAFLSPRAGDLSDKYGPRGIASIGLVLTALGLTAFALFPRVPVSGAAIFLVFIGLGAALFGAPNNSAIMGSVKKMHHGIASSILALSRNLGQALSMAVVTFIMTTETAKQPSYTDGVLAALHASFVILAVLCFLAVAASLARGHHQKKA